MEIKFFLPKGGYPVHPLGSTSPLSYHCLKGLSQRSEHLWSSKYKHWQPRIHTRPWSPRWRFNAQP